MTAILCARISTTAIPQSESLRKAAARGTAEDFGYARLMAILVAAEGILIMPEEFHEHVIAIARRREELFVQIAKDFEICDRTVQDWVSKVKVDEGVKALLGPRLERPQTRRTLSQTRLDDRPSDVGSPSAILANL